MIFDVDFGTAESSLSRKIFALDYETNVPKRTVLETRETNPAHLRLATRLAVG